MNTNGNNINGDHGAGSQPTNTVAPKSQYEVPLTSLLRHVATPTPTPITAATNTTTPPSITRRCSSTPPMEATTRRLRIRQAQNYAPLQQLSTDLTNNTVASYNWITPDQYNDMHSALNTDFTYNGVTYTAGTDAEQIALGDNFLSIIVPEIEASQAYKNNGMIVIWNDETEGDEDAGSTAGFEGTEIIISPLAKGNAYTNNISVYALLRSEDAAGHLRGRRRRRRRLSRGLGRRDLALRSVQARRDPVGDPRAVDLGHDGPWFRWSCRSAGVSPQAGSDGEACGRPSEPPDLKRAIVKGPAASRPFFCSLPRIVGRRIGDGIRSDDLALSSLRPISIRLLLAARRNRANRG